jgi:hypothetical protein
MKDMEQIHLAGAEDLKASWNMRLEKHPVEEYSCKPE